MRCMNGEIYARLVVRNAEDEARCQGMGITDTHRVYRSSDLAPGRSLIFAATGVTGGPLMKGVRFFGDGTRTESLVMQTEPRQVRFIDSIHVNDAGDVTIRF
jgi:fructose-1,6-bisphosphatase II